MNIISSKQLKVHMRLAQNIYRGDGLLAFQKGDLLDYYEVNELKNMDFEYIVIAENKEECGIGDTQYMMGIIQEAFKHSFFFETEFVEKITHEIEKYLYKYKKTTTYLAQLREKASYFFVQSVNAMIIMAKLLKKDKKYDEKSLGYLLFLVLVHDVGMLEGDIGFDGHGRLDDKEFKAYQKHPEESYTLLKKAGIDKYDLRFVVEHHEKYDGTGFPSSIRGKDISELAQLLHLSASYNGLVQLGPNRKIYTSAEAIEQLKKESGTRFDPDLLIFFLEHFTLYQIGDEVELTNGMIGTIIQTSKNKWRPVVKVEHQTIDLSLHKDIMITRIIRN